MGRRMKAAAKKEEMAPQSPQERYRIAVLGVLTVESKRSGKTFTALPQELLASLGVRFEKDNLHIFRPQVSVPRGLEGRALEAECERLEEIVRRNDSVFPPLKAKRVIRNGFMGLWPLERRRRERGMAAKEPDIEGPMEDGEGAPTQKDSF